VATSTSSGFTGAAAHGLAVSGGRRRPGRGRGPCLQRDLFRPASLRRRDLHRLEREHPPPLLRIPAPGGRDGQRPARPQLSLALNYAVSGTDVWSYHALNLSIHILSGLALFGIVRRTLERRAEARAPAIAFCAALLWVVHPLLTESVTYIVQRAESLMGLFYLLTLYAFIRACGQDPERPAPGSFSARSAACSAWQPRR